MENLLNFKEYLKNQVFNLSSPTLKIVLGRQRIKFSRQEIWIYLCCLLDYKQQTTYFIDLFEKYKRNNKVQIQYRSFLQNIKVVSPLFKFFLDKMINQYLLLKKKDKIREDIGLSIKCLDSTLLKGISQNSLRYEKHKDNTTKRKQQLITGKKLFIETDLNKIITYVSIQNIRKSDITFLKENLDELLKDTDILLTDSGFMSKSLFKQINNIDSKKVISPIRLANKERKGNSFEHFSDIDKQIYYYRYSIEDVFKKLKDSRGKIKLKINFSLNEKLNQAIIYSSILELNLQNLNQILN